MGGGLLLVSALFLLVNLRGDWGFVLGLRGTKLAALILVAVSVSTSTVLFQTITQNRILTPSVMGYDALYAMILMGQILVIGAETYVTLPVGMRFLTTLLALVLASMALFGTMLGTARNDLMRLVLTGLILGVMFRSLTGFLARMADPNEYQVIQVNSFARFNQIETDILGIAALLCGIALVYCWRLRHRLDVVALGRDRAVSLGENPDRVQLIVLMLIGVLVSVSTALVGPVSFLGLLVVSIAHVITPTPRHAVLLVSAGLVSGITLVLGQLAFERVFSLVTPLSVVIDLFGGLVFLILLLRGALR